MARHATEVGRAHKHDAWDYMTAIDLLWLDDYVPDRGTLTLDDEILNKHCPIWAHIREGMEKWAKIRGLKLDFGIFMLWPRIFEDLKNWSAINEVRQRVVGRAAFALSSISLSDWFVR